jgi:P27 family predicted phage terminase small subunit
MPARLPTRIKKLRGTFRQDRARPREPQPRVGAPRPSRPLTLPVQREYDHLVRRLLSLRVLTTLDGLAVELCAQALSEHWQLMEVLANKGGPTYETETPQGSKMIRLRPEAMLAQDAWRRASAMLQQLGMTPVARSRVQAVPPPPSPSKWGEALG